MLVNFCDKCLRTEVTCSTVSTEGYEVTNLVNNSDNGFLAYSCIRPPVTIDFTFICNIKISHVLIWPQVGAQKSSGFKLSVKSADTNNQPFVDVSTAFLQKSESGVFFHRRDVSNYSEITQPPNFAERYIKILNITNYVSTLRLSILRTDNSVPALGKIEIWASVSPKCGKDICMNVTALWLNRLNSPVFKDSTDETNKNEKQELDKEESDKDSLNIPEDFLDPITMEIMTQPIILPSGKIIDQKTLEKHGHTEAIWGRPVSDPFTGIRFNETHKPIAALPLKARIDKFLLENSNREEIKKLPRVLGSRTLQQNRNIEIINCVNKNTVATVNTINSNNYHLKRSLSREENSSCSKKSFHGHLLPIMSVKNSSNRSSVAKMSRSSVASVNKEDIDKQNALIEEKLNSKVQVTSSLTCQCCSEKIFYKLPCEHIICRKALLSLERNQCTICKLEFTTSDPQRLHIYN